MLVLRHACGWTPRLVKSVHMGTALLTHAEVMLLLLLLLALGSLCPAWLRGHGGCDLRLDGCAVLCSPRRRGLPRLRGWLLVGRRVTGPSGLLMLHC